jgi:nucleoside-diphosphate-sugar epimerase
MKLLFTGASVFLGANLNSLLKQDYEIETLGLTDKDDHKINIANVIPKLEKVYDVVLHAAGKAHVVPKTEKEKKSFFDINYQGTVNLCKALERSGLPEAFVFISTVAVYGLETGANITEEHPLNGDTPLY